MEDVSIHVLTATSMKVTFYGTLRHVVWYIPTMFQKSSLPSYRGLIDLMMEAVTSSETLDSI
jgi:hypothetical protein